MRPEDLSTRAVKGVVVSLTSTGASYIIAFATQVVLVRLLEPEDFGQLAFAAVAGMLFISLTNAHGDKYVIKTTRDVQHTLNVAFTATLILALGVFVGAVWLAPPMMEFLGKPHLTSAVRFMALLSFYSPLVIPRALFERNMDFVRARYPSVIGQVVAGGVAITLALSGFGVWSLLWWRVCAFMAEAATFWLLVPHRPKIALDVAVVRSAGRFAWPLFVSGLVLFVSWNADYYIVGQLLGEEQLGFYWLGFQVGQMLLHVRAAMVGVLFPTLANAENMATMRDAFARATRLTLIGYMLMAIVVLGVGEEIVRLIFGAKWEPAVAPMKVLIVATAIRAVVVYWQPVFIVFEKNRVLLALTTLSAVTLGGLGWLWTQQWGIVGMAFAVLLSVLCMIPLGVVQLKKLLEVSYAAILGRPLLIGGVIGTAYVGVVDAASSDIGKLLLTMSLIGGYGLAFRRTLARDMGVTADRPKHA